VRAPFAGSIAERLVSVGDYVTRGTKVAVVVRTNPLRVKLTVPEQFISTVGVGQPVNFEVDAYPGKQFVGKVQFVSPSLQADQRALTIEAVVPNPKGELKPGLFATARIEQRDRSTGVLIPTPAVQTAAGTSRVFVVHGDKVEERIVTIGQVVGDRTEISSGLKTGEQVATRNLGQLIDGTKVQE
jgi:membrane fusion protein (multidrug efflux system)